MSRRQWLLIAAVAFGALMGAVFSAGPMVESGEDDPEWEDP